MKNTFLFLSTLLIAAAFITNGCSKDDGDNWAGAVEGTYVGTVVGNNAATTVLITRVADKQFSLQFNYVSSSNYSFCMDSVIMNAETTFIINEYDGCYTGHVTGGGNFNGAQVDFTVLNRTVTGTKQ